MVHCAHYKLTKNVSLIIKITIKAHAVIMGTLLIELFTGHRNQNAKTGTLIQSFRQNRSLNGKTKNEGSRELIFFCL